MSRVSGSSELGSYGGTEGIGALGLSGVRGVGCYGISVLERLGVMALGRSAPSL